MTIREPVFYKDFRCAGGRCPLTCCRDWSIVPDEGALNDYAQAPAGLREAIADSLVTDGDGDVCFRLTPEGRCALLDGDGLCSIQRRWGEAHLCAHCAAYPRFNEEYGCLTENSLAVSCPEAARLTMERGIFPLRETDDGRADLPFDGVDAGLLSALTASRGTAFSILSGKGSLWGRLARLLDYAAILQGPLDRGNYAALVSAPPPPSMSEDVPPPMPSQARSLLLLLAELDPLRPEWPALLDRRAREQSALSPADCLALADAYAAARPRWEVHLERLAEALLFRHWPKTVNDGLLYGRAAFVWCACAAVHHLSLLAWREDGRFTDEDECLLWARFSREVEHDEDNFYALVEFFQKALDNGGLLL